MSTQIEEEEVEEEAEEGEEGEEDEEEEKEEEGEEEEKQEEEEGDEGEEAEATLTEEQNFGMAQSKFKEPPSFWGKKGEDAIDWLESYENTGQYNRWGPDQLRGT